VPIPGLKTFCIIKLIKLSLGNRPTSYWPNDIFCTSPWAERHELRLGWATDLLSCVG
jgi:hypothetical protein